MQLLWRRTPPDDGMGKWDQMAKLEMLGGTRGRCAGCVRRRDQAAMLQLTQVNPVGLRGSTWAIPLTPGGFRCKEIRRKAAPYLCSRGAGDL